MGTGLVAIALWLGAALDGVAGRSPQPPQQRAQSLLPQQLPEPPLLQLQGQPYAGGKMSAHVIARSTVGQWTLLVYGYEHRPIPLPTSGGLLSVGGPLSVLGLGPMPPTEQLTVHFRMPESVPATAGATIVLQGVVGGQLSNPATLPLDAPYYVPAHAQVIASPHPVEFSQFGDRMDVGDLNGDGVLDLVVGAWFEDIASFSNAGRAYVFWGPSFTTSLALGPPSPKKLGFFGESVSLADVDGDRVEDLIVGESYGTSSTAHGHFYVYRGGRDVSATPSFSVSSTGVGPSEAADYGRRCAIGDLDGDGLPDLAVGVDGAKVQGLAQAGRVDVFWAPDFATHTEVTSPTPQAAGFFGAQLAIGDIDGDGLADLLVDDRGQDIGGVTAAGRLCAFRGGSLKLLTTIDSPLPPVASACFGSDVHVADLDADGIAEIVANDLLDHVFLFRSTEAGLAAGVTLISKPPSPVDQPDFAFHMDCGDVNGDGVGDLILADAFDGYWTPTELPGSTIGTGMVHVALGPDYATFHNIYDKLPVPEDEFGFHFIARDLDGDGRPELIVGASFADDGGVPGSGHVTVFSTP